MVALGEHVRDFVLEVEAFSEDQRALRHRRVTARTSLGQSTGVPRARRQGVQRPQCSGADAAGGKLDLAEQLVVGSGRAATCVVGTLACVR